VPTHKSENALLDTAGRKEGKWVDAILKQLAENTEDGARWLCTYLEKKYDTAFMTAATELGYPSVARIYSYNVIAMFDDAHLTIRQMKVIKQYLWRCLDDRVFIPDRLIVK
jgi:hypothetical protein